MNAFVFHKDSKPKEGNFALCVNNNCVFMWAIIIKTAINNRCFRPKVSCGVLCGKITIYMRFNFHHSKIIISQVTCHLTFRLNDISGRHSFLALNGFQITLLVEQSAKGTTNDEHWKRFNLSFFLLQKDFPLQKWLNPKFVEFWVQSFLDNFARKRVSF